MSVIKRSDIDKRYPEIRDEFWQLAIEHPHLMIIMEYKYIFNDIVHIGISSCKYGERTYSKNSIQDIDEEQIIDESQLGTYITQILFNIRIFDHATDYTLSEYSIID